MSIIRKYKITKEADSDEDKHSDEKSIYRLGTKGSEDKYSRQNSLKPAVTQSSKPYKSRTFNQDAEIEEMMDDKPRKSFAAMINIIEPPNSQTQQVSVNTQSSKFSATLTQESSYKTPQDSLVDISDNFYMDNVYYESSSRESLMSELNKLNQLAIKAEKALFQTLDTNQKVLFQRYKDALEGKVSKSKIINVQLFSKALQIPGSVPQPPNISVRTYTRNTVKIKKKTRPAPVGDMIFAKRSNMIVHTSKVPDNLDSPYVSNLEADKHKVKVHPLLVSLFKGDPEYEALSPTSKMMLQKVMEGHDDKCSHNCEHLKRAAMIKNKDRGVPYPIRKTDIIHSFS